MWAKGVLCGTPNGQTFQKRQQMQCSNGIRDQGVKLQLCLGSKGNLNEVRRQTVELKIIKRIVGSSVGIRKIIVKTLCRSCPPNK
jgi:hypothetical protein